MNTSVILAIQLRSGDPFRSRISPTANRNADARRIELRGANAIGRVQCDDLIAEDIVAALDRLRNRHVPCAVRFTQNVVSPLSSGATASTELQLAHLGNLEELQGRLVDGCAVAVAGCQVRDDGAVVGFGPFGPVQVDEGTCGDGGGGFLCVGRVDGADDVGAVDGVAVDWAQVGVPGGPADGALVGDPGCDGGVVACVVLVIDVEGVDPAVC